MKIALCVLGFFVLVGAAFGQSAIGSSGLNAQPVIYEFASHEVRAQQQGMGLTHNIMEESLNVTARGVRPLWEVHIPSTSVPLCDSARMLRKEHVAAKKAEIVWNN
jgi:hypothetical protein